MVAVPTVVLTKNSAGSVTTTTGTFSSAVASGNQVIVGVSVSSDTPTITAFGPDSKGNVYKLVGNQVTAVGKPIWIYASWITTSLTTSDTLAITISAGAVINLIGVVGPGVLAVPKQFTSAYTIGGSPTAFSLAIPALPSTANGFMLAFSVNASAAPTWLTPGPTVLTTLSGGGGPFFSCAYEDVDDFPASMEIDMSPASSACLAATAFMSEYTDLYLDTYTSLYGQYTGTRWPQSGNLGIQVQLLLNGTWTDITPYVYQRDGSMNINITCGRLDESQKVVAGQCDIQLNNRNGIFSSKNTSGPFYPFITRNTQMRVLIPISYNSTDAGFDFAFSGEVSSWPPSWDETGQDVWVDVVASGIIRRLNQSATLGSSLRRFYLQKDPNDPTYPIAYWPMEDGSTSSSLIETIGNGTPMTFIGTPSLASDSSFGGSDPIPVLNNGTIFGLTNSPADPGSITYTTPGVHVFTPRSGLTTLTAVEHWGPGGGGTNGFGANTGKDAAGGGGEYAKETGVAITADGRSYNVTVGSGGAGGRLASGAGLRGNAGTDGGVTTSTWDAITVTANGGKAGTFVGARVGKGGTGSTNATHFNGGDGGKNSGGLFGGSGGGSSAGTAANGNNGSNGGASNTGASGGSAPTGGAAGGQGGNGGAGVDDAGNAGTAPGAGGGSGGENSLNSAAHSGGNGGAGKAKISWTPLPTPTYNVTRFLLHVPSGGDTNGAIIARVWSSGIVNRLELTYTTAANGTITMTGQPGTLFTSVGYTGVNGVPLLVSMELTPGSTVGYRMNIMPANNPSTLFGTAGTASASGSIGVVSEVDLNPNGNLSGTSVGHVVVQYTYEPLSALSGAGNAGLGPVSGWNQEKIGHRFGRLCAEEGIPYQLIGDVEHGVSISEQMGPQPNGKLMDVLQQLEDLNGGFLSEDPTSFGLTYRAYADILHRSPAFVADYNAGHISPPFAPVEDDQLIKNDVTVSRVNGSSVHVMQTTGPLSTAPPPNGVGSYTFELTVNCFQDSQLLAVANRILGIGTADERRFPQVSFVLSRSEVAELMGSVTVLNVADRFQVINPPSFLQTATIDLLVLGFSVVVNPIRLNFTLNCVPADPYI